MVREMVRNYCRFSLSIGSCMLHNSPSLSDSLAQVFASTYMYVTSTIQKFERWNRCTLFYGGMVARIHSTSVSPRHNLTTYRRHSGPKTIPRRSFPSPCTAQSVNFAHSPKRSGTLGNDNANPFSFPDMEQTDVINSVMTYIYI